MTNVKMQLMRKCTELYFVLETRQEKPADIKIKHKHNVKIRKYLEMHVVW